MHISKGVKKLESEAADFIFERQAGTGILRDAN
jgi:hypothetical protein